MNCPTVHNGVATNHAKLPQPLRHGYARSRIIVTFRCREIHMPLGSIHEGTVDGNQRK